MIKRLLSGPARLKKIVRILLITDAVLLVVAGLSMYRHYASYPGTVEKASLRAADNGRTFIQLSWDEARNADSYHVFYKLRGEAGAGAADAKEQGEWTECVTSERTVRIKKLKEGTSYYFAVRADKGKNKGKLSGARILSTQRKQTVKAEDNIIMFTDSEPLNLETSANTALSFTSSDPDVVKVDEKTGALTAGETGTADITIKASESTEFSGAEKTVEVRVLDAHPVSISSSSVRIIYYLDFDNVETMFGVSGDGGAVAPQGLAYTGDKYMMTFGSSGPTRIITYNEDGSGKSIEVPSISLGHPNGFTYSNKSGLCYCVRGRSSACVIYDTNNGSYSRITMPVGCSGIGYDPVTGNLCTSARKSLVVYDPDDYTILKRTGVVPHSGTVYRQDCCAYDDLILCCVSGSNRHGTNYIDIYDMKNSNYVGTIQCDLSEVESIVVNSDGFLEILSNGSSRADYLLRTDLNIKALAAELHRAD